LQEFGPTLLYSIKRGFRSFSNGRKKSINIITYFSKVE
jgi:hypothetical protein